MKGIPESWLVAMAITAVFLFATLVVISVTVATHYDTEAKVKAGLQQCIIGREILWQKECGK